jgi:chemotaxis protein methyltransferase CheR
MNLTDKEFGLFKEFLFSKCGSTIGEDKRYLFTTRLTEAVLSEGFTSFFDFYTALSLGKNDRLRRMVVESMTTHESGFFRDGRPFQALLQTVLPEVSKRKITQKNFLRPKLRILSAGCGFGQEPYSIAIIVSTWLTGQKNFLPEDVTIIGIDISGKAVDRAKTGRYSALELGNRISREDRGRYFTQQGPGWTVSEKIRAMVGFERKNISEPLSDLGKFDIVFCRNVTIYFPLEVKQRVFKNLQAIMEPYAALFIGAAESLFSICNDFTQKTLEETCYYETSAVL